MKSCTPLWCEAHFEVKMLKALHVGTTFGSVDVEQVRAVVARSTFRSQKCKKLTGSEHFWKFRCRTSTVVARLLEVEMSKKCMRLWREARFEVKSVKN